MYFWFSNLFPVTSGYLDLLGKSDSEKVSEVVDAYEHALLSRFPRARYLVGMEAATIYRALDKCPEWLADLIMGILFKRPLPACLSKKTNNMWTWLNLLGLTQVRLCNPPVIDDFPPYSIQPIALQILHILPMI